MDRTKDIFKVIWRRKSLGLSQVFSYLNVNSWFEGAIDVDSVSIGNPTEFKQNLNVTVGENGDLIGTVVISTFVVTRQDEIINYLNQH